MRGVLIYYNALAAVVFAGFLAYTLVLRSHVEATGREFVTQKTVEHSRPLVDSAEALLNGKTAQLLLSKKLEETVRSEIAEYRQSPQAYIAELTGKKALRVPEVANDKVLQTVVGWKKRVVDYYDKVLDGLVLDLRVFALTNVVAACAAVWFAVRATERMQTRLLLVSGVLCASMVLCTLQYYDSLTFFKIITNSYSLSAYPLGLTAMFVWLYSELEPGFRPIGAAPESVASSRDS
jgi:hypothetical protein